MIERLEIDFNSNELEYTADFLIDVAWKLNEIIDKLNEKEALTPINTGENITIG